MSSEERSKDPFIEDLFDKRSPAPPSDLKSLVVRRAHREAGFRAFVHLGVVTVAHVAMEVLRLMQKTLPARGVDEDDDGSAE